MPTIEEGATYKLVACPMKEGMMCCAGTPRIIAECRCGTCFRVRDLERNDPFMRFTWGRKGVRA